MNRLRLLLLAAALCPLVGCEWMKNAWHKDGTNKDGKGREQLPPVAPEQFVAYLNDRADRLQAINYADVRVVASDRSGLVPLTFTLNGWLVAGQPRNFRMKVGAGVGGDADLGSNDQQFWVYLKVPANDAMFVYASHTDFENGKAKIPGGIPFEPEWVMQAFGMAHFPLPAGSPNAAPGAPTNQYTVLPPDQTARTYTMKWPAVTPGGGSVVKEVVFDGDSAAGTRPQVKKHVIRDTRNKVICSAEVKEAKTLSAGPDGQLAVQFPTKLLLKWEEQKFEMELTLTNPKINQPISPDDARRRFTRPEVAGVRPHDLAVTEFRAPAAK